MTPDEFEQRFNAAVQARDRDAPDEAIRLLEELLPVGLHRPLVLGWIGLLFLYEKEDPDAAEPLLRETVQVAPRWTTALIAFFHTLVDLGRMDEALAEAERFLALRDSERYRRLLQEMGVEWPRP